MQSLRSVLDCVNIRPRALATLIFLSLAFFPAASGVAKDWPNYRGPDLNGISTETEWNPKSDGKIAWKAQVGLGHSAFVVANGVALVSGNNGEDTDTLFCFDEKTGDVVWKHSYPHPVDARAYDGGTTATATIDGDSVYQWSRRGHLFCLDAAKGTVKWKKNMKDDFGYDMPSWGFTGAPLVRGDRLYLNAGDSGLVLNKKDGSVVWQSKNGEAAYSMPYPVKRNGEDFMIFGSKRGYVAVNADTGKEAWRLRWMTSYGVNASDPIATADHVFISTGYGKGATLLQWDGRGDPKEIWKSREMRNQMNPCVLVDGFVYGIDGDQSSDRTGLKCVEMMSGETKWLDTSVAHGAISAANGNLIVLTESGELRIGPISPEGFKASIKTQVLPATCWTVPVLANGRIFCRNDKGAVAVVDVRK